MPHRMVFFLYGVASFVIGLFTNQPGYLLGIGIARISAGCIFAALMVGNPINAFKWCRRYPHLPSLMCCSATVSGYALKHLAQSIWTWAGCFL